MRDGKLLRHIGSDTDPIDVLYAGWTKTCCCHRPDTTAPRLRPGLLEALAGGKLTIANSLGNGIADDKAIYA